MLEVKFVQKSKEGFGMKLGLGRRKLGVEVLSFSLCFSPSNSIGNKLIFPKSSPFCLCWYPISDFLVFISSPKLFYVLFFPCAVEGEEECSSRLDGHILYG